MEITQCNNQNSINIFGEDSPIRYYCQDLQDGINIDPRFDDVPNEPNQTTYTTTGGVVKTFIWEYYYAANGGHRNGIWILKQGSATWIYVHFSNAGNSKARISSLTNGELEGVELVESTYGAPPNFNGIGMFIENLQVQPYTILELMNEIAIRMEVV